MISDKQKEVTKFSNGLKELEEELKKSKFVMCIRRVLPLFLSSFLVFDMLLDVAQTKTYYDFAYSTNVTNLSIANEGNANLPSNTANISNGVARDCFKWACIVWAARVGVDVIFGWVEVNKIMINVNKFVKMLVRCC